MSKPFQRVPFKEYIYSLPEIRTPYKDVMGRWLSLSLFADMENTVEYSFKTRPVFTLNEEYDGFICARKTFVDIGDPTGYTWAMTYLESYDHFKYLMKSPWFKTAYEEWVTEIHLKQRANALRAIKNIAESSESSDAQRLSANKYLAERPYEKIDIDKYNAKTRTRGRPSKEELTGELKRLAEKSEEINEDFERVNLKVIKGGKSRNSSKA